MFVHNDDEDDDDCDYDQISNENNRKYISLTMFDLQQTSGEGPSSWIHRKLSQHSLYRACTCVSKRHPLRHLIEIRDWFRFIADNYCSVHLHDIVYLSSIFHALLFETLRLPHCGLTGHTCRFWISDRPNYKKQNGGMITLVWKKHWRYCQDIKYTQTVC